jgi:hypothetical protein
MSDAMSFAALAEQSVELLPARTVLSMFAADGGSVVTSSCNNVADPQSTAGLLGLFLNPAHTAQQCTPASVIAH